MARMMALGAGMLLGAYRCHPCHPWWFGRAREDDFRAFDQSSRRSGGCRREASPPGFVNIPTDIPLRI
jgi:hypothetical protein